MSQSPTTRAPTKSYLSGWQQIGRLVRDEGRSFSGREAHCCFVNTGQARFAQASSATGLDYIDDGRASAVVDWDLDGDLDIWLTNRTGPRVRYLQNQAGNRANFIAFRLVGTSCNRDAIGTRLELQLAGDARKHIRTLHAGDGFLSQSTKWLHFGLAKTDVVESLLVRWPDGQTQRFEQLPANGRYRITQGQPIESWSLQRQQLKLTPAPLAAPAATETARIVLASTRSMPQLPVTTLSGERTQLSALTGGSAVLLNLWQYSCLPCLQELREFSQESAKIRENGLNIIALHLSAPDADLQQDRRIARQTLQRIDYPLLAAAGLPESIEPLEVLQQRALQKHRGIVFPTSLLINEDGRVVAIYKGPLSVQQLLQDVKLLRQTDSQRLTASLPFAGKWFRGE